MIFSYTYSLNKNVYFDTYDILINLMLEPKFKTKQKTEQETQQHILELNDA
jgi:hypothetical protein